MFRRKYPQLLKEYGQYLEQRQRKGEIKEVTRKTYLNDANRVLECLLAASSQKEIAKIMVGQQYKGYYKKVIRDLKVIMTRRSLYPKPTELEVIPHTQYQGMLDLSTDRLGIRNTKAE